MSSNSSRGLGFMGAGFGVMAVLVAAAMSMGERVSTLTTSPSVGGQAESEEVSQPAAESKLGRVWQNQRHPLQAFLDLSHTADVDDLVAELRTASVADLQFLIVTVPDPIDSAVGHTFDAELDTLQTGVANEGYVIDRHYLPWTDQLRLGSDGGLRLHHSIPGIVLYRKSLKLSGTDSPSVATGLLCVYLVGETPVSGIHQRAFLHAVDEMQTLQKAFHQSRSSDSRDTAGVADTSQLDGGPDVIDLPLHVVGPNFSGSADSLARAIARMHQRNSAAEKLRQVQQQQQQQQQQQRVTPALSGPEKTADGAGENAVMTESPRVKISKVVVVSGSASNVDPARFKQLCEVTPDAESGDGEALQVRFYSVRLPSRLSFLSTIKYLRELASGERLSFEPPAGPSAASDQTRSGQQHVHVDPALVREVLRIAWLSESNTGFGRWLKPGQQKSPLLQNLQMAYYTFPMHLSRVRHALDGSGAAAQKQMLSLPEQPDQQMLQFLDELNPTDSLPQLTPGMTNPTNELLLSRILAAINEQGVRYVGITATDIQDRIFLCERLHRFCPDVQIILDGASRIYTAPRYRTFMKGVLVTSNYPLDLRNQAWSYPYLSAEYQASGSDDSLRLEHTAAMRELAMSSEQLVGFYNALVLTMQDRLDPGSRILRSRDELNLPAASTPLVGATSPSDGVLPLLDYGSPFLDPLWPDGGAQTDTWDEHAGVVARDHQPPLWVSMVGNGVMVPLAYVEATDAVKLPDDTSPVPGWVDSLVPVIRQPLSNPSDGLQAEMRKVVLLNYTPGGRAFLTFVLGGILALTVLLWRRRYSPLAPGTFEPGGLLARRVTPQLQKRQVVVLLGLVLPSWCLLNYCTVGGLIPHLVHVAQSGGRTFYMPPLPSDPSGMLWLALLSPLALGALSAATLFTWRFLHDRSEHREDLHRSVQQPLVFAAGMAGVLLLFVTWRYVESSDIRSLPLLISILEICLAMWISAVLAGLLIEFTFILFPDRRATATQNEQCRAEAGRHRNCCDCGHLSDAGTGLPSHLFQERIGGAHCCMLLIAGVLETGALVGTCCWAGIPFNVGIGDLPRLILQFERTFHVMSGVSWGVPFALLTAAMLIWSLSRLGRLYLLDRTRVFPPWPCLNVDRETSSGLDAALRGLNFTQHSLERILFAPCEALRHAGGKWFAIVFFVALGLLANIARGALPCPEGWFHTRVLWFLMCGFCVIWVYWQWELLMILKLVRRLLRQVAWLPMPTAFLRLPEQVRILLGRFLSIRSPHRSHIRVRVQYVRDLFEKSKAFQKELSEPHWRAFREVRKSGVEQFFADEIMAVRERETERADTNRTMEHTLSQLGIISRAIWTGLVVEWGRQPAGMSYPQDLNSKLATDQAESASGSFTGWKNLAEELLAIQVGAYLTQYLFLLRHLLITSMGATVCFLLMILSYPLQPRTQLTSLATGMVTALSLIAVWVFVQIERDELLSRVQGTRPNEVQFDLPFLTRTFTWLLPTMFLTLSQLFPGGWTWLYLLLEPVTSGGQ